MVKEVNIPFKDEEHRKLKAAAALKGMSMRDFCRQSILKEVNNAKKR